MGFAASVAGRWQLRRQRSIWLQFGPDGMLIPHLQQALFVMSNCENRS